MIEVGHMTPVLPPNAAHTLEEFERAAKVKEVGWKNGMPSLLKVCEDNELYEYCAVIKKELDRDVQESNNE